MIHLYEPPAFSIFIYIVYLHVSMSMSIRRFTEYIQRNQAMHSTETPPETPCYTDNPDTPPSAWEYKTTADGTG